MNTQFAVNLSVQKFIQTWKTLWCLSSLVRLDVSQRHMNENYRYKRIIHRQYIEMSKQMSLLEISSPHVEGASLEYKNMSANKGAS